MRFFLLRFCFLLITLTAVVGCGKKGALYLPDSAKAVPAAGAEQVNPSTLK